MGSLPVLPFRANRDRLFSVLAGRESPEIGFVKSVNAVIAARSDG
jgi:hypothetical protein